MKRRRKKKEQKTGVGKPHARNVQTDEKDRNEYLF